MMKLNIVGFSKFTEDYQNNLRTPSCLPRQMGELCGGCNFQSTRDFSHLYDHFFTIETPTHTKGTQETFKQIIQKITKKNTAPLQLWFDSWQSMEIISIKKASLKEVFRLLDTRGIQRIDSCELFSVMLFTAKGDYEAVLSNISYVFGFKNPQALTKDEFFFFLDSFFRGISKILIQKNQKQPLETEVNKRLSADDIRDITDRVFGSSSNLSCSDFAKAFQKSRINGFFEFLYNSLQKSNDVERQISLENMQISLEVKKAMLFICQQVEKNINGEVAKK